MEPQVEEDVFETAEPKQWLNRQRTLFIASKGLSMKEKEFFKDLVHMTATAKTDSKLEKRNIKSQIEFACRSKHASNFLYFEKRADRLMLHGGKFPHGPTVRYLILSIVPCKDFKFHGNALRYSRPVLSFSSEFESIEELKLFRYLMVDCFNCPKNHPKAQPFVDRVWSFSFDREKSVILIRHHQIFRNSKSETELVEIGPRVEMQISSIISGFFEGELLYKNDNFISKSEFNQIKKSSILRKKIEKKRRSTSKVEKLQRFQTNEEESSMDEF